MKIETSFPVSAFRGSVKNSQLSYSVIQGQTVARAKVAVANPNTPEQQLVRSYITNATKNWDNLTRAQRDAWTAYAKTYFADDAKPNVAPGLSLYVRANVNRQVLGLALTSDAPTEAPPAPLQEIASQDGENPDTLGLVVTHSLASVVGMSLFVRMTPATASAARKPMANDLRYVKGATVASTAALPATGASVLFTPTRYSVADGRRFGVEGRIVRSADGIPSLPTLGDFTKVV